MSIAMYHKQPDVIHSAMEGLHKSDKISDSIIRSAMVTPEVRQQVGMDNIIRSAMPEHKMKHANKDATMASTIPVPATGATLGVVGFPGSHYAKPSHAHGGKKHK